ncbi:selenoneine synthase SenA [Ramlibacter sp. PS3R-8]|uniref:selenoneine synthase SenA n=1 Tax=Ramlibacter sp. PS3R-8 TaxID=3133437 RepID=UPI00309FF773
MDGTSRGYSAPATAQALALRQGAPADVRAALLAARARTLRLAEDFRAALGASPQLPYAQEINPPLWELGHVGWFQEWWTARNPERHLGVRANPEATRRPSLLPQADAWYDSSHVEHRLRWQLPLPDRDATLRYLANSFAQTLQLLDELPADAGDDALYFFRLVALHEEMHSEAAVYMGHGLGIPLSENDAPPSAGSTAEIPIGAASFEMGCNTRGFAFDNELGAHTVALAPGAIDAEPVTWGAYLPFVQSGGYEDPRWWSPQGRAWLNGVGQRGPAGLKRDGARWQQARAGQWHAVQDDEVAVHLSAHEADAWCRWAGRRLPTEAEWEWAATTQPGFRWGQVWEWTASRFEPFPGFAPHPYRDYSVPWFGTRRVLRGASRATSPALAHARYRNFYEPHRRDIFAGFRSARAPDAPLRSGV